MDNLHVNDSLLLINYQYMKTFQATRGRVWWCSTYPTFYAPLSSHYITSLLIERGGWNLKTSLMASLGLPECISSYSTLYQNPFHVKKCFKNALPSTVLPKALVLLYLLVSRRVPGSHKTQEQGNKNLVCSEWVLHLIVDRRFQPRQGFKSKVVCITMNSNPGWQPYYQRHSAPFNQRIIPKRRSTQMWLINNNLPEKNLKVWVEVKQSWGSIEKNR